ncbi:MAG: peroxiredoxin [Burkholderiaceae bacterium]
MKINVKDLIPKSEFFEYFLSEAHGCSIGVNKHDSHKLFEGKKVVLTGVPGAFTPTCSEKHLPDFIEKENEVRALGINEIFFMAVNDPFVMAYWGTDYNKPDSIRMIGDPEGSFTKEIGLDIDLSVAGLGLRSKRFTAVIEDNIVTYIEAEDAPPDYERSSASNLTKFLKNR